MVAHRFQFTTVGRWIAFLSLVLAVFPFPARSDDSWRKATALLASKDYLRAISLFKEWAQSTPGNEHSPQYHRNLAKAYWELGQAPDAVYHLAQSARFSFSLWGSLKHATDLAGLERELGVRDGLSGRAWFMALFLTEANWMPVVTALGFWVLIALVFFAWTSEQRMKKILKRALPVALVLILIGLAPLAGHWFRQRCGVLWADGPQIAVYKKASRSDQQKLIELPAGTIVFAGEEKEGAIRLSEPVGGWVASNEVRWLFR